MVHPILKVRSTSEFEKSFRKLPARIQDLATKKDKWFRHDAFDQRLNTHKLKGELDGNEVIYYDVGTHDIYR